MVDIANAIAYTFIFIECNRNFCWFKMSNLEIENSSWRLNSKPHSCKAINQHKRVLRVFTVAFWLSKVSTQRQNSSSITDDTHAYEWTGFVDASSINKRIKRLDVGVWCWDPMHRKEMMYFLSINRIFLILYIQITSFSQNSDELCWLLSALRLRWCLIEGIYFLNREDISLTLFWLTLIWERIVGLFGIGIIWKFFHWHWYYYEPCSSTALQVQIWKK